MAESSPRFFAGAHAPSPEPCEGTELAADSFCVRGYTHDFSNAGAVSQPIVLSSTFAHPVLGETTGFDYGRGLNPTRLELERTLAVMEHCSYCIGFSSGMAAISCLLKLFSPGDEIVVSQDLYGGTWRLFAHYESYGLKFIYVDTSDLNAVKEAVNKKTKALYVESPSNPMMRITDLESCAALIHSFGKDRLFIADNTFLSPYCQNPVDFGADVVIHSGTKFLSGHHDCISGFLMYNSKELDDIFRIAAMSEGACLSPFDAWLVLRGLKTLAIRMERSGQNAVRLAEALRRNPSVERVFFPVFEDAPGHSLFMSQSRGWCSMISFYLRDEGRIPSLLKGLRLISFAESLGGVQSLITYPVTQTHNAIPQELRQRSGVNERLLRLSVGIENAADLLADLEQALD